MFYAYLIDVVSLKMIFKGSKHVELQILIIYFSIMHFGGYCIINGHLMHNNEWHNICPLTSF
jgi:hypothetical protein